MGAGLKDRVKKLFTTLLISISQKRKYIKNG